MSERKSWVNTEKDVKAVTKPWGNGNISGGEGIGEFWLNYDKGENVGDKEKKYVLKKLYVKAGSRLSFQYHEKKIETNYILSGEGEAWLENQSGEIEKSIITSGDTWTIQPNQKHRIIATTDLVLLEASSPEVDDVVRLQDDSERGDGRVLSEHSAK